MRKTEARYTVSLKRVSSMDEEIVFDIDYLIPPPVKKLLDGKNPVEQAEIFIKLIDFSKNFPNLADEIHLLRFFELCSLNQPADVDKRALTFSVINTSGCNLSIILKYSLNK